jgi:hypothetical protein
MQKSLKVSCIPPIGRSKKIFEHSFQNSTPFLFVDVVNAFVLLVQLRNFTVALPLDVVVVVVNSSVGAG